MSTTSVIARRVLPAEVQRVFDAWGSAEALSRWFVVDPTWKAKATTDFRIGGKYRIEMDRGDGTIFLAFGEYLKIESPRLLVFTWNSAIPVVQKSVVTIELKPVGTQTELTLTHELLPDTDEGRAHAIGWDRSLANLEQYLSGESSFAPIVDAFATDRDVSRGRMFGSAGLKVNGRVFAMLVKGRFVAKLPKARVDELVGGGKGEYFDPGHGKRMKEWVSVPAGKTSWMDLAREAHRFVKGGK